MFGMGMPEVILILVVGLVVIGPKKLPELAKSLGKGIVEFKRATQDFRDTIDINDEVSEFRDTVDNIKTDLKEQLTDEPKKKSPGQSKVSEVSETLETQQHSEAPSKKQESEDHGKRR